MSEMAVICIRVKAERADEFERMWEAEEFPRWRDYHARGLFKRGRFFRSSFGTQEKEGIVNYLIVVESEGEGHHEHDNDPGFKDFDRRADELQAEPPFVFGGEPLFGIG